MRLIDVDYYCEHICKCNRKNCNVERCPLQAAPTAFDVDKVVEEMQKQITEKDDWQFSTKIENDRIVFLNSAHEVAYFSNAEIGYYNKGVRSCIEIVKKGGMK